MHRPGKRKQLRSLNLSLADISRIYKRLLELVQLEGDKETSQLRKPDDTSEEKFRADVEALKAEAFRITVTITGRDGETLYGDDESIFASPNLPGHVSSIYMTNSSAFEAIAKSRPQNVFELFFDFSKPPLVDSKNFVSSPTPNNSNIVAEGTTDSWVASIHEALDGVIRHRQTRRTLLHRGFAYDFGQIIFGIPFAFYCCARAANFVSDVFGRGGPFLTSAAYVYIFFVLLFAYRIFFGYAKWAFPTLELEENRDNSLIHRFFWSTIALGLLVNFIWEIMKYLATS